MCSTIPWQEWDFDRCPEEELGVCYFYEVIRERVLRIKDPASFAWHEFVKDIRTNVGLNGSPSLEICTKIRAEITNDAGAISGAHFWYVLAGSPEWPLDPYLSIAREERLRRLELLLPEFFPKQSPAEDIIPERLPHGYETAVHIMTTARELPIFKSDIASMLDIELAMRDPEWKPGEPAATNLGSIVTIKIPWDRGKEWFLRHASTLWKRAVPDECKRKMHGGSRGTDPSKNLPALHRLGAYRLIKVWKLSIPDAISLTEIQRRNRFGEKLGALYLNENTWSTAARDAAADLMRF